MGMQRLSLLIVFLGICTAWGYSGEKPKATIRLPSAWTSESAAPIYFDIKSTDISRFRIILKALPTSRWETTSLFSASKTVAIPVNALTRIEMTLMSNCEASVIDEYGNLIASERIYKPRSVSSGEFSNGFAPIVCVNNFMSRELSEEIGKITESIQCDSIPIDELPSLWQSYSGFVGTLVFSSSELKALRPEQKDALVRWVEWMGGRVWVVGDKGLVSANATGLILTGREFKDVALGLRVYSAFNGLVWLQNQPDAAELLTYLSPGAPFNFINRYNHGWERSEYSVLRDLRTSSTGAIIFVLLVLAIIMGPLNLWYIRKKKNPLLFFIITPVVAVSGAGFVFAVSIYSEGFQGRYRESAVLISRNGSDDAMLIDVKGVASGLFPAKPTYPRSSLLHPISYGGEQKEYESEETDGITLTAGWLVSRYPTGMVRAMPVAARMKIQLIEDAGSFHVFNGLDHAIKRIGVLLPNGQRCGAENIKPGEKVKIVVDDKFHLFDDLVYELHGSISAVSSFSNPALVAECEGLPYLGNESLNARRLDGQYYYYAVKEMPLAEITANDFETHEGNNTGDEHE